MESIISGCGKFNRSKDKDLIESRSALVKAWIDDVERAVEKVDKNLPDMMARHIADICYRESEQLKKQTTMERKIGEILEYKGEWYQCVEDAESICVNCCFYNGGLKLCTDEDMGDCAKEYRSDAKSICFKKLEKVGEPYMTGNKLIQRYKIYPTTCCINVYGWYYQNLDVKSWTIDIELKQTKEDMDENKTPLPKEENSLTKAVSAYINGKISDKELIKSVKEMPDEYPYDKSNLKPFSLEAAKQGKPVCTRDGRKARIICFDRKDNKPIVALMVRVNGIEILQCFHNDGKCFHYETSNNDLMMLTEKKEGWINVYNSLGVITFSHNPYDTKEEALEALKSASGKTYYVDTIKISWEE